jgi:hypothetical protein
VACLVLVVQVWSTFHDPEALMSQRSRPWIHNLIVCHCLPVLNHSDDFRYRPLPRLTWPMLRSYWDTSSLVSSSYYADIFQLQDRSGACIPQWSTRHMAYIAHSPGRPPACLRASTQTTLPALADKPQHALRDPGLCSHHHGHYHRLRRYASSPHMGLLLTRGYSRDHLELRAAVVPAQEGVPARRTPTTRRLAYVPRRRVQRILDRCRRCELHDARRRGECRAVSHPGLPCVLLLSARHSDWG